MLIDLLKDMDAGGYYFFNHFATNNPGIIPPLQLGDWLGSYVAVGLVIVLAVVLFLLQGRTRAAQITLGAFVFGVILVEILRNVIAVHRPADAQKLVDADEMLRSFPPREVFTFTLAAVLLLFAAWGALHKTALRILVTVNMVVLVLWVAMSQLVLSLHYVTDVIGGLAGGVALALVASRFFPPSTDI